VNTDSFDSTAFVFAPPPVVTLPVAGSDQRFAVRRIYCVGRNYADHIREMGGDEREPPFFFQKPTDAIVPSGAAVVYPSCTSDFQHEVELVLAIGREGRDIARADASRHVYAVGVGIDLTRRDVQVAARKSGRPWEIGKSFDQSAPCSELRLLADGLPNKGRVELEVNGELKQSGDIAHMIWSCAEIVSQLSSQYRLMPGDLIYTGTPAGIGPLQPGDHVVARIEDIGVVDVRIVSAG
jgi:fumarylpyruvate hydrolase